MPVCQPAVLQNLEKNIKDIGMGLFNFIEKQDRIRLSPTDSVKNPPSS